MITKMITYLSVISIIFQTACKDNNTVYICTGSTAHAFHDKRGCKGLSNCRGDIKPISEEVAVNKYHRRPCYYCH